jgi:hypothetical protein
MSNPHKKTLSEAASIIMQHEQLCDDLERMRLALGLPDGLPAWAVISAARDMAMTLKAYQPTEFARAVSRAAAYLPAPEQATND